MRFSTTGVSRTSPFVLIASGLWVFTVATAVSAVELPQFKPGLWEFKRTVEMKGSAKPHTMDLRQCIDPTADMRKSREMGAKGGCTFLPLEKSGNAYSFVSDCLIGGATLRSRSVITTQGTSAYTVNIEAESGTHKTKEVLVAKRIGECAKGQ